MSLWTLNAEHCMVMAQEHLRVSRECREEGRPVAALRCLVEAFDYLEAAQTDEARRCKPCNGSGFIGDRCCRGCDGTGRG